MKSLIRRCLEWDGNAEDFAIIVKEYLVLNGNDPRPLAEEFECAVTTISRWADGFARPRPRVMRWVVRRIAKLARDIPDLEV